MSQFFGPLDSRRSRAAAAADARRRVPDLGPWRAGDGSSRSPCPGSCEAGWQTELNAQFYREAEIVSLLLRATSWVPDLALLLPGSFLGDGLAANAGRRASPDRTQALTDRSSPRSAHAVHAAIRPAALLPVEANASDPFAMALRRIEFESGRLMQAQILLLKSAELVPFRDAVSSAVERRHAEIRKLWAEALEGVGIIIARTD